VSKGHANVTSGEIRIPLSAAMASQASSAPSAPKITTSMSGTTVTLLADGKVIGTVTYVKNGKVTFNNGGYVIDIEFNGNGVKSTSLKAYPVPAVTEPEVPEIVYLAIHCGGLTWKTGTFTWKEWEVDYVGDLNLKVMGPIGPTAVPALDIVYNGPICNGIVSLIEGLSPGIYNCVLTGDDINQQAKSVTIVAGETGTVSFNDIMVDYSIA
jgi:hypothetical protein